MKTTICLRNDENCKIGKEISFARLLERQPPDRYSRPHIDESKAVFQYEPATLLRDNIRIPLQYPIGARLGVRETWARKPRTYTGLSTSYENETIYEDSSLCIESIEDTHRIQCWRDRQCSNKRSVGLYCKHHAKKHGKYKPEYVYKSDGFAYHFKPNWHSPATMPHKAIRKHIVIESNTVKRVQDITIPEIENLGISTIYKYATFPQGMFFIQTENPSYNHDVQECLKTNWNSLYAKPRKYKDGYVCYPWNMDSWFKYMESTSKCHATGGSSKWKGKPLTIYANPYIELPEGRVE